MNLENTFVYVTHHSESIIQWVFLAIILMAGFLIARGLFGKKEAAHTAGAGVGVASVPEIEAALAKIVEQTTKLERIDLKDMKPADVASVDAQVQALRQDLAAKEAEIAQLKAAAPAGGGAAGAAGGASAEATAKVASEAVTLGVRIKELEAKLAEYEILEDDIADLSLFKEENSRLRTEIEQLKAAGPSPVSAATPTPVPAPAAPVAAAAEAPQPQETSIVDEFAKALETPGPAQATAGSSVIPNTGDPMKDFENTVQLERQLQGQPPLVTTPAAEAPVAAPAVAAAPAPAAPPVAPTPAPAAASAAPPTAPPSGEAEDLFAEFASAPPEPSESSSLDTDKMMAEMAALVSVEPSSGNALEEGIDIEKMAAQAGATGKS